MTKLRENGFAVALAAGLVLALAVGAVYAIAAGSRRLATQAEALHATHQTIQSATVARGQLELAAYQASLAAVGLVPNGADLVRALSVAELAISTAGEAHRALRALEADAAASEPAAGNFAVSGRALITAIESGDSVTTDQFDEDYTTFIAQLGSIRDTLASAVSGSEKTNALVAALAGFLVVLVIPAAVIITYFVLDRRRRRQYELDVTLQAERAAHTSRERFLTTVSHQLREPLWAVRGISRMLGNDELLMAQPRMADLHLLLAGELDDMTGLMDNLLTASRLEAGGLDWTIEPIDVREAARTVVDSLDHRGASIYVAMDEGLVNADRRHLRQMLRNLISNALKYGGPNIEVKGHAEADSYAIVVVDDGQGVPRSVEDQLFSRFVHDDREADNVGLGLSIVMALAVGMGGTAFHQREDGLTRFGVVLPRTVVSNSAVPHYLPPAITPITKASGQG